VGLYSLFSGGSSFLFFVFIKSTGSICVLHPNNGLWILYGHIPFFSLQNNNFFWF
jgi:hypothetical protein